MTCHDCENMLQCHLDGEANPDRAALDAHLAACSACRSRWTAAVQLGEGLRQIRLVVASPELSTRIVAGVLAEQRTARRLRHRLTAVAALAAAVLVVVLLSYYWRHSSDTPAPWKESPVARDTTVPHPVPEIPHDAPSLRDSITQVAKLTLRKADETFGEARSLLPKPLANDGAPVPPEVTPPGHTLREAGNGVTAGLEPVADSARRAWNLFLRDIPPVRAEEKRGS